MSTASKLSASSSASRAVLQVLASCRLAELQPVCVQLKQSLSSATGGASDAVNGYLKQLQDAASAASTSSQGTANDVAIQVKCRAALASCCCLKPEWGCLGGCMQHKKL